MAPERIRIVLVGLGNVGRRVLHILHDKADLYRTRHSLEFAIVGAADSQGAAWSPDGLSLQRLVTHEGNQRNSHCCRFPLKLQVKDLLH